jgi:diguanylate cyclase (GGDEF)-like protein/PAS domain S-box-containing protein
MDMRPAAATALLILLALLVPTAADAAKPARTGAEAKRAQKAQRAAHAAPAASGSIPLAALGAAAALLVLGTGAVLTLRSRAARRREDAVRDEAERVQAQARTARDGEQRVRALLACSAGALTVIDEHARVVAYPESLERALGIPPAALEGRSLTALLSDEEAERTLAALASLAAAPDTTQKLEWTIQRPGGGTRHVEAVVTNHLDDPRLNGFVLNVHDVTDRRMLELELRHRAFHDDLTGLANRALLEDRLRHAIARAARTLQPHAVIFLDLDDFQGIVDAHGDAVGDELLVNVGRRLHARLRANDTLARISGDVFGILIEDVPTPGDALLAARRLIDALREPFHIGGHDLVVGASAGVEVGDGSLPGPHEEIAARELLHADVAMRTARQVGSGTVERYASEMHTAVAQRVELRAQIRAGLRRGEFIVHYQPIVDLQTERTVGFEALARWEHPTRGLLGPGEFIPVAERTGLILDLGNYVLREACAQVAEWNAIAETPVYVSVNVAGAQLHNDAFVDKVAAILRGTGLAPEHLLLEVTETALVRDSAGSVRRLQALRDLGVRLGVDDFGTGYSSLNYLRRFPMDVLKVDKSFVDELSDGAGELALVDAIVGLGRALELTVVAEGIEERPQAEHLRRLGCQLGQGYLFSKPLPADAAAAVAGAPVRIPTVA